MSFDIWLPENQKVLPRTQCPALDEQLGLPIKVLDKGFIRVIDYMGDDGSIVQAARVSYGAGTKHVSTDRHLIRFMMRHGHTSPFEQCELKLHVKVPMDAWRQWIRHRTASVNEYSTRYSIAIEECQHTGPHEWRTQATTNRQGSGDFLDEKIGAGLTKAENKVIKVVREFYHRCLGHDVAREQARKNLLLCTYTEAYWKIDLHNLFHFLSKRLPKDAQLEIRMYAVAIAEVVKKWVPHAWEAFEDYVLHSMKLSRLDIEIISLLNQARDDDAIEAAREFGWLDKNKKGELKKTRERIECEEKLLRLGLPAVWLNSWKA